MGVNEIKGLITTEGFMFLLLIQLQMFVWSIWSENTICGWLRIYATGFVGGVVWVKLSEMYNKSLPLPRQICIIVAVTNAIITGVDHRTERGGEW